MTATSDGQAPWDDEGDEPWPAKARRLGQLARAGLPVPSGLVVAPEPAALDHPPTLAAVEALLERGPVVVRSALDGEDELEGSAAGLGCSRLGCHDVAAVREALTALATQRDDPWLAAYRHGSGRALDRAIVQQEIPRRALLVLAVPSEGGAELEAHTAAGEALAEGRTPEFAGPLATWDDPARAAVQALVERTVAVLGASPHGHDLEIVIAPDDRPYLVQARPLAAPLHPGWPDFHAALVAEGSQHALQGELTLDAEHNPAPLSPAHAWLMRWLRTQRPKAGDPTVLAGWLYVRTLVRDLAKGHVEHPSRSAEPKRTPTAVEALQQLHDLALPQARARLHALSQQLDRSDAAGVAQALPHAQQAFLDMIDAYIGVLVPARTVARRALGGRITTDAERPLSTRGRAEFLDVLPATWDLASPSLAELGTHAQPEALVLPDDEAAAATLLGEWDDHLFALGLAPLRAWYLAAGRRLGLHDDVFMLEAPEVVALLEDLARHAGAPTDAVAERITARRERLRHHATLRPPLRIHDGHPVSFARRARLRGIPLGPSFTGRLAPRSDLAALLADPPGPDAIVVLPSLTAPAAVALQQLGVRAVCCEHGGPLSHAALMVRELGLSALVGCRGCTELPAGRLARIDTQAGRLVLEPMPAL
jgi:phosphohistidine swiveling domain-containing protein